MMVDFTPDPNLYPFGSRWFTGAGPRVHYVDEGRGPAVVMFHGNPTWSFLYRKVILGLRDGCRCIAVDYPGFGLSERPAGYGYTAAEHAAVIGKLVDHLRLDGFTVLGQDWGGPIGMTVAMERADRVSGMVFANTWYWPAEGPLTVFSLVMSSPPFQWLILQRNFFVNFIMPRSVATKLDPEVFKTYQRVQPYPEARRGVAEFPKQIRQRAPAAHEAGTGGAQCPSRQTPPARVGDEGSCLRPRAGHPAVAARLPRRSRDPACRRQPLHSGGCARGAGGRRPEGGWGEGHR